MKYNDFRSYLENNTRGCEIFLAKATDYQNEKNKKRQPAKRWNESKVLRAVNEMWEAVVKNAYEKIKAEKGVPLYNGREIWISFMDEVMFLEEFDNGIAELDLSFE